MIGEAEASPEFCQGVEPGFVFDPGTLDSLFANMLCGEEIEPMHCSGVIIIEDIEIFVPKILFDTGALHASYIDEYWLDEQLLLYPMLNNVVQSVRNTRVRLGDNQTIKSIDRIIDLDLSFVDTDMTDH